MQPEKLRSANHSLCPEELKWEITPAKDKHIFFWFRLVSSTDALSF